MANRKRSPITYKREKNKIEISGDPEDVKWPMWADLISSHLSKITLFITLLLIAPKASFIPILLQWLKKQISSLIFFADMEDYLHLLLSG